MTEWKDPETGESYLIKSDHREMTLQIYNAEPNQWALIDADLKLTHLDMDLCAKGPANVYTALGIGVWNAAIDAAWQAAQPDDSYQDDWFKAKVDACRRIKELKK
jgi:hypothetical protein